MSDLNELLERFRRGPEVVATLLTGAAGPELDFASEPGKWTIRQIAAHLADSELVAAARLRRVIAEDNPPLAGYDQNAWTANLHYEKRKPSESVDLFRRVRASSYELLKDLPAEAYARTGNHSEAGVLSLLDLVRRGAEHAEGHARQIAQAREAYKQVRKAHA